MRVIVYVEGPSDKAAMESLLEPLIMQKLAEGKRIEFFETPSGDRKKSVLEKVPVRAVNILRNDPDAIVVAMPDLYPMNKSFPHETTDELFDGIRYNFERELQHKGISDVRIEQRFKVFCFKYDLEALILAAEEALGDRLGVMPLDITWVVPVEDQNHGMPPKRVVQTLFHSHGESYQDTVDAPVILASSRYETIAKRCPQCFKPFIDFLEVL